MAMVSVIVPIYKVERYLKQCIQSILKQSYSDLEIILVDDGSPDRCPQICDAYADQDARVKVIHKKNGGLVSAWSEGVYQSTSEYIAFVDADDWISPQMIEMMVEAAVKTGADIAAGCMSSVCGAAHQEIRFCVASGFYDRKKMEEKIFPVFLNTGGFQQRGIPISRWGKLIRRSLLMDNMKYRDERVTYSEDLLMLFPVILSAKSFYIIGDTACSYFYRYNSQSMLHAYDKNMCYSIQSVYTALLQICEEKGYPQMRAQIYADYLAASVQYFKNELVHPEGLRRGRKNIIRYIQNPMVQDSIRLTDWSAYPKRNRLIIYCMKNYNGWKQYFVTPLLRVLKMMQSGKKARAAKDVEENG